MKKLRVLKVVVLPRTTKVKITSEFYEQSITIPFDHEHGSDTPKLDTALKWCKENDFNVLGYENSSDYAYIVTDTDKPLK